MKISRRGICSVRAPSADAKTFSELAYTSQWDVVEKRDPALPIRLFELRESRSVALGQRTAGVSNRDDQPLGFLVVGETSRLFGDVGEGQIGKPAPDAVLSRVGEGFRANTKWAAILRIRLLGLGP